MFLSMLHVLQIDYDTKYSNVEMRFEQNSFIGGISHLVFTHGNLGAKFLLNFNQAYFTESIVAKPSFFPICITSFKFSSSGSFHTLHERSHKSFACPTWG